MTPLTRRRLKIFRSNKKAYWSLWIFMLLFSLSLFAELIANDKPIIVEYQGHYYFPVLEFYPEKTFGGDFDTEPNYRDVFIADNIKKEGWMIWPPIHYSYQTINYAAIPAPSPPTGENLLGTDDSGGVTCWRV